MNINKIQDGEKLTLALEGRLDTTTAPQLQTEVEDLGGVKDLVFDFDALDYVSSAGLRVLLKAQKIMTVQGGMKVINVNPTIMEILDMTGFTDILTVEPK